IKERAIEGSVVASITCGGIHHGGNPNLDWQSRQVTVEFGRRDADNLERNGVDRYHAPKHSGIAVETRFPKLVADNGNSIASRYRILFGQETSSQVRLNPEKYEVVAGNK